MSICPSKGIENHPAWAIGHFYDASEMSCEIMGDMNMVPIAWIDLFRRVRPGDSTISQTNPELYPTKKEILQKYCESHKRQINLLDSCSNTLLQQQINWSFESYFPPKIDIIHFMAS